MIRNIGQQLTVLTARMSKAQKNDPKSQRFIYKGVAKTNLHQSMAGELPNKQCGAQCGANFGQSCPYVMIPTQQLTVPMNRLKRSVSESPLPRLDRDDHAPGQPPRYLSGSSSLPEFPDFAQTMMSIMLEDSHHLDQYVKLARRRSDPLPRKRDVTVEDRTEESHPHPGDQHASPQREDREMAFVEFLSEGGEACATESTLMLLMRSGLLASSCAQESSRLSFDS